MKNTHITTLAVFALFSASAAAENPYAKENNSWISINGEVDSVSTDQFELDYAGAMDEQDIDFTVMSPILRDTVIKGNITHVSREDEEFTLDTGIQMLTVEVDELLTNPLDNEGYLQLSVGDRVSVNGKIDNDLFEGRVFEAVSVTKI